MIAIGWRYYNFIILLGTAAVVAAMFRGVHAISQPVTIVPNPANKIIVPSQTVEEATRPTPSEVKIAGEFNLQRIKKPEPIEITPPPPANIPSAPVVQFNGRLLGTLVDSDPMQSYALINLDSSIIKLTKHEEFVDPPANSFQLMEVHAEKVVLKHIPSGQTLSLEVERR